MILFYSVPFDSILFRDIVLYYIILNTKQKNMCIYIYICSEGMLTHLFFLCANLVWGLAKFKCSSSDQP